MTDNEIIENSMVDSSNNEILTEESLSQTLDDSISASESVDKSHELSDSSSVRDGSSKSEASHINVSDDESDSATTPRKSRESSSNFETSEINLSGNEQVRLSTAAAHTSKFETSEINLSGNESVEPPKTVEDRESTSKFKTETKASDDKLVSARPMDRANALRIVDSDSEDDFPVKESSEIYTIESSDDDEHSHASGVKTETVNIKNRPMVATSSTNVNPFAKHIQPSIMNFGIKSEPGSIKSQPMVATSSSNAKPIVKFETKSESNGVDTNLVGVKSESGAQSSKSSKLNASQLVDDVKPIHLGNTKVESFLT